MKGNALIVAGGQWQVPIIQFLKSRNYYTYVADPYTTSPGVIIADNHIQADVRDFETIKSLIDGKQIDLVTTDQSDISVETVSRLSVYLGLKGNPLDAVKKFTNKLLSRQYAQQLKIPVPQFFKALSIKDIETAILEIGLPVILKPVDSQSSRGIFKIDETNVGNLSEYASGAFKETHENYILVEKWIDGTELTVEGICSGRKHKTIAVSRKKHFRTGIASDLEYPAILPPAVEEALVKYNDTYVENSGLQFGITHAEYFFNEKTNKLHLVEIACRGGGSLISSDIAKWVSGIDLYEILMNDLNGLTTDIKSLPLLKRSAILHFFEFPDGKVENISGLDEIAAMKNVKMIKLDFKAGDEIKSASDDRSRQGFVIVLANNKTELSENLSKINGLLKVKLKSV